MLALATDVLPSGRDSRGRKLEDRRLGIAGGPRARSNSARIPLKRDQHHIRGPRRGE